MNCSSSPSTSADTDAEKSNDEEENRDLISELPHSIRMSILALLTLKEAATTSVLSKCWRQTWTFHPDLDLRTANIFRDGESCSTGLTSADGSAGSGRDDELLSLMRKYVSAVDAIVRAHQSSKVDSFRICFRIHDEYGSHLQRWIDRAAAFSPDVIDIDITGDTGIPIFDKLSLYTFSASSFDTESGRSHLRYLRLQRCNLVVSPPFGGFRSLLTLVLEHSWLPDEDLCRLFSKCSSLESVELNKCRGFKRLKVDSSSTDNLRVLTVTRCVSLETVEVVDLGKLLRISCDGKFGKFYVQGDRNYARVDHVPNGSNFFTLPNFTHKLRELSVRFSCYCEPMQLLKGIPVMTHMRMLRLDGWSNAEKDMNWVFLLTNQCPFLEELIIDMSFAGLDGNPVYQKLDIFAKRHHFYLREVRIIRFYDRYECLLDLAVDLLAHAVNLRKMTINRPHAGRVSRRVYDLLRERAAADVELVFHGVVAD